MNPLSRHPKDNTSKELAPSAAGINQQKTAPSPKYKGISHGFMSCLLRNAPTSTPMPCPEAGPQPQPGLLSQEEDGQTDTNLGREGEEKGEAEPWHRLWKGEPW